MKRFIPLLCLAVVTHTYALEDTPENRAKEAARYLAATPPEEMLADMSASMAQTMPEAQRAQFLKVMNDYLDMAALKEAIKQSNIKIFTADELKALADFYSTPEGKSAMKKMGPYMADVMPAIQAQIMAAMKKSQEAAKPAAPASTP